MNSAFKPDVALDDHVRSRAADFGHRIRKLRLDRQMTIRDLAKRSGTASSTISKVENAQMSPTYDNILRLAVGLGVTVETLFNHDATAMHAGRRSITRAGEGARVRGRRYSYDMLCSDIANKMFVPIIATIPPQSADEPTSFTRHTGEEFVYVLKGSVRILTDTYSALLLSEGDSCYFDSTTGHMLVSAEDTPATVMWVASHIEPALFAHATGAASAAAPATET